MAPMLRAREACCSIKFQSHEWGQLWGHKIHYIYFTFNIIYLRVKYGGRKGSQTRTQGVQCCLHEAPTTPGTFHPFLAKRRIWHTHQSAAYLSVSAVRATFVKMYGDIIAELS